ncbi:hypothetical protein ACFL6C_07035, partial [Myxococcota bacterium]
YYVRAYTPTDPREVGASQRHDGVWNDSRYRLVRGASGTVLGTRLGFVEIDGLQIAGTVPGPGFRGIWSRNGFANGDVRISNNIVVGPYNTTDSGVSWGIEVGGVDSTSAFHRVWNNIVYDMGTTPLSDGIIFYGSGRGYVCNNTIYGGDSCVSTGDGIVVAKNNVALDCRYGGDYDARSTHNASSDGIPPGQSPILLSSDSPLDYFVGSTDFHIDPLAPNADKLIGAGADLSTDGDWAFTTDIDGSPRSAPWEPGADEVDP